MKANAGWRALEPGGGKWSCELWAAPGGTRGRGNQLRVRMVGGASRRGSPGKRCSISGVLSKLSAPSSVVAEIRAPPPLEIIILFLL